MKRPSLCECCLVVVLIVVISDAQFLVFDDVKWRSTQRGIRDMLFRTTKNSPNMDTRYTRSKLPKQTPADVPFPCDISDGRSVTRPRTVHNLRPGDVDVIAALGDSLSCAFAATATTYSQMSIENRGRAWSGGGQGSWRDITTLPNILKEFNPQLYGYAVGDSFSYHNKSRLNVGEVGAISRDMPFMVGELLNRMINDPKIDMQNDWKVITLMIGGNDFCINACYKKYPHKMPENHRKDLLRTLRFLRDNIPRTFVNLVPVPVIKGLIDLQNIPEFCTVEHHIFCPCLTASKFRSMRNYYYEIARKWNKVEEEVAKSSEFRGLQEFAVVYQPYTLDIMFPVDDNGKSDITGLAIDCFHLSLKGHGQAGLALYRNMLQKDVAKDTTWKKGGILCPGPDEPFLKTYDNV